MLLGQQVQASLFAQSTNNGKKNRAAAEPPRASTPHVNFMIYLSFTVRSMWNKNEEHL